MAPWKMPLNGILGRPWRGLSVTLQESVTWAMHGGSDGTGLCPAQPRSPCPGPTTAGPAVLDPPHSAWSLLTMFLWGPPRCTPGPPKGLVQGGPARAMEEGNAGSATGAQIADPALSLATCGRVSVKDTGNRDGLSGCPQPSSLVPSVISPPQPHHSKEAPSQTTAPAPCALGLA